MIKINPGFQLRNVCGENVVVAMGEHNIDFSHLITLNETSLMIWDILEEGVDDVDDIVSAIMQEYEIDAETCRNDVEIILQQLQQMGVITK